MAVRDVEWSDPILQAQADPELEAIARRGGRVGEAAACYAPVRWAYLGNVRLSQRLLNRVALDHDLADLAELVVSQDNSCRYCYALQRALLRGVGFTEERIQKLEETFLLAELGPRERAALEFARSVSRSNPLVTAVELQPLRDAGFSPLEVKELAVIAGLTLFFNRISTIAAVPPQSWEALPDRWLVRWLQPLIKLYLNRRVRLRARPVHLRDDQRQGPFSYLTNALDGHPVAGELRQIFDEMWASDHLSRRAKALCFAVVARALGSARAEAETAELATKEGLSSAEFEETLANLASPALDPVERLLVPFSRQTVWYQVPDLQRHARELRDALPVESFVEAVTVLSHANVVARLGFLADAA